MFIYAIYHQQQLRTISKYKFLSISRIPLDCKTVVFSLKSLEKAPIEGAKRRTLRREAAIVFASLALRLSPVSLTVLIMAPDLSLSFEDRARSQKDTTVLQSRIPRTIILTMYNKHLMTGPEGNS